jgi:hypothetical protein
VQTDTQSDSSLFGKCNAVILTRGMRWHCAISRNVAAFVPIGVIGSFCWLNP